MQRLLYELRTRLAAPSRNARTAVVIGRLLGAAFVICFATGLYSHFIQDPLPWMHFATRPIWLYQVTQGLHIVTGIACFPLITAKLYAVFPELFQTPPVRGAAHLLERASITLFVASSLVQITIGLINTYQWYALFPFPFRQTHFALSFVVIGSLAIHIGVKLPVIARHWRKRDSIMALAEDAALEPEKAAPGHVGGVTAKVFDWIDRTPAAPKPLASRRAFFTTIAVAGAAIVTFTAGQSFRVFDATNLFAPRRSGTGKQGLPVNRTARAAKVLESAVDPAWVLTVAAGARTATFSRAELAALPQHTVDLPIACVEGWSQVATWTGPRLKDLVDRVGGGVDATVRVTSLEQASIYAVSDMGPEFARDDLTLVALKLDGEDLDMDHGYPARIIAPARPGVLQTKWISRIEALA